MRTETADVPQRSTEVVPASAVPKLHGMVLALQRSHGNAAVCRMLARRVLSRDPADEEIDAIEAEKLAIGPLLDRCAALVAGQRDQMIAKVGGHAASTHEERLLASLLAARFKGTMRRADFFNTYHELLERLEPDQQTAVLDYVGPATLGKVPGENNTIVDKRSINNVGMKGAPGSWIDFGGTLYVITDEGVQFKTSETDGPAARNNNPGNITVNDSHPEAWGEDIGAYRGRHTPPKGSVEGRFAIFPTPKAGRQGAIAWATKRRSWTLLRYFETYAPWSEQEKGNNPRRYANTVARHVSAATGKPVDASTTIDTIISYGGRGMEAFVDGQIEEEGYKTSNVKCVPRDSSELPSVVRDFALGFSTATDNTKAIATEVAVAAQAGR